MVTNGMMMLMGYSCLALPAAAPAVGRWSAEAVRRGGCCCCCAAAASPSAAVATAAAAAAAFSDPVDADEVMPGAWGPVVLESSCAWGPVVLPVVLDCLRAPAAGTPPVECGRGLKATPAAAPSGVGVTMRMLSASAPAGMDSGATPAWCLSTKVLICFNTPVK
jgi:hypothetical protein